MGVLKDIGNAVNKGMSEAEKAAKAAKEAADKLARDTQTVSSRWGSEVNQWASETG